MEKYNPKLSKCKLCESEDINFYHRDYLDNDIYICHDCGIQFLNPQYTDEHLDDYYSDYTSTLGKEWVEPLTYGHGYYMSIIERYAKPGDMLDFGSGNGILANTAKTRGWDVEGYDVDCESTQRVSKEMALPIYCGDFSTVQWKKNEYDLVTMHQVLEHLKDPKDMLEQLLSKLKKGGIIFVAVPNIGSFSARLKFFLERIGLRKKRIGRYYDTDHHLFYYKPKVLKKLLSDMGLEILYSTGCHKVGPGQSKIVRFIKKYTWEKLLLGSAFLVVAKK